MARIAENAGVAKSLLHYHFGNKSEMFLAVQVQTFENLLGEARAAISLGAPPISRLRTALDAVYRDLEDDRAKCRLLVELHCQGSEEQVDAFVRFERTVLSLIEAGIREILGPENLPPKLSVEASASMVLLLFRGVILELAAKLPNENTERTRRGFDAGLNCLEMALSPSYNC